MAKKKKGGKKGGGGGRDGGKDAGTKSAAASGPFVWPAGVKVGAVFSCEPVRKKNNLWVVEVRVDAAAPVVPIVTSAANAPDLADGSLVVVACEGVTVNGMAIKMTKVGGEISLGMLCGPRELGWTTGDTERCVVLAKDKFSVGDDAPRRDPDHPDAPTLEDAAAAEGGESKGDEDCGAATDDAPASASADDKDAAAAAAETPVDDADDAAEAFAAALGGGGKKGKKKKKKGGKPQAAVAAAAGEVEEEEEEKEKEEASAASATGGHTEDTEKKPGTGSAEADDDAADAAAAFSAALGAGKKKKGKKGKKGKAVAAEDGEDDMALLDRLTADATTKDSAPAVVKDAPSDAAAKGADAGSPAADDDAAASFMASLAAGGGGKKKKKGKKGKKSAPEAVPEVDDDMALLDSLAVDSGAVDTSQTTAPEDAASGETAAKDAGSPAADDDAAASFMASLGGGGGGKKKKKGKKGKQGAAAAVPEVDDELEFLAAQAASAAAGGGSAPAADGGAGVAPGKGDDMADEASAFMASLAPMAEDGGEAKDKKGKKKKKGKKDKGGGAKKAVSGAAAAARAKVEALRKAQEEEQRQEEERRRQEEEEERRIKEIEEKERLRKEAKKARLAEKKKLGLVKTKAEREKDKRRQAMLSQFQGSGGDAGTPTGPAPTKRTSGKPQKRGTGRMKRKEEEEARRRAAAAEALLKKKAEEAVAAAAAEEAKRLVEEEEGGGDWDDEDWETADVFIPKVAKEGSDDDTDENVEDEKRQEEERRHKAMIRRSTAEAAAGKKVVTGESKGDGGDGDDEDDEDGGGEDDDEQDGDEESSSDYDSDEDSDSDGDGKGRALTRSERDELKRLQHKRALDKARAAREARHKEAMQNRSADDLRSPILCVLGHVDTGKTKLLDKIRKSNVQDGEAGGITQQIGATFFPTDMLKDKTERLNKDFHLDYRIPGLLVIDTPGHESFTNLRSRGSSLCDIAVLVVDMMHGLEPQTIESLEMLRARQTPFVVALNKVDRLFDWKVCPNSPIREALSKQPQHVLDEFETRTQEAILAFNEQGLNCSLYYENDDFRNNVSLIPTSAHSGEGIPDLLLLVTQLTQEMLGKKLRYCRSLQCTLLEVKVVEGLGTTIDVVLVNGLLKEGDTIVVCGLNGPIVTTVRGLLTPPPASELRVKTDYVHHKEIKAAMGIKLIAQNLEHAVPGTSLFVQTPEDSLEELKRAAMEDFDKIMSSVNKSGRGVSVQASTLGALEALLEFLRTCDIPVASIAIGPVHKKDVVRASVMLEHQVEYATMLAFDVKVEKDAKLLAEKMGVRIFTADIIYHLFDAFTKYMDEIRAKKKEDAVNTAVFPVIMKILKGCVFHAKNPIIIGCEIEEGILRVGTPICIPAQDGLEIGRVASIESNHEEVPRATKGQEVCVKIQPGADQEHIQVGRQFDETAVLYSKLSRDSIDSLKENHKEDLGQDDWRLVIRLKEVFNIS